ncbi:MAG: HDOD domain-containing protein [bacterium]
MPEVSAEAKAFVRAVGASADFPAFVGNVRAISRTAGDMEARVALLQDAIVQDVSLTAKIIRIANSVANAPGSTGVSSVKQAILLLGFDRVRHLAMAASVFDHMQKKAPGVSELLTISVLTANQSLQLAPQAGYHKGEIAYLCGLFRNLGEILVACYRTKQYNDWLAVLARDSKTKPGAERALLGFTFEEAGIALAQRWKMPGDIVVSMRRAAPPADSPAARLHAVTQLSSEITNAVYRRATQTKPGDLGQIVAQYARPLGLDTEAVVKTAKAALADSQEALTTMNASFDEKVLTRQIEVASVAFVEESVEHEGDRPVERRSFVDADVSDEVDDGDGEPEKELAVSHPDWVAAAGRYEAKDTDSAVEAKTRDALRTLNNDRLDGTFDVGRASRATLDAIVGAGYRRAIMALSSEDFSRVRGRMGAGPGHENAISVFLVRPSSMGGPLGISLLTREDLFVDMDADESKLLRRDRLLRDLDPKSFGLLPLVIEGKLLGCLYFDDTSARVNATPALRDLLKEIRDHLVAALASHRR